MTAEELAAIYEPAFEAAGERPTTSRGDGGGYILSFKTLVLGNEPVFVWVDPENRNDWLLPTFQNDAANACRCWAEEWILKQTGEVSLHYFKNEKDEDEYGVVPMMLGRGHWWGGPTIHHALAAAVIAVAKSRPTAPAPTSEPDRPGRP